MVFLKHKLRNRKYLVKTLKMYICSSGGWISLTGTGSSFTWHLLKHLQLIVHFLRDSRGGDSAARLPGWTVWSWFSCLFCIMLVQTSSTCSGTNRLGYFECGRLKVHPITFHVLVLLLLLFISIILFLDVFKISTCLSKTGDDRVKVLLHLIYLFNDDVFTFLFVCLL